MNIISLFKQTSFLSIITSIYVINLPHLAHAQVKENPYAKCLKLDNDNKQNDCLVNAYSSETSNQPYAECLKLNNNYAQYLCMDRSSQNGDAQSLVYMGDQAFKQEQEQDPSLSSPYISYDNPQDYWEEALKKGSLDAKSRLAKLYYYGKNKNINYKEYDHIKAFELWQETANEGNADAQFHLATLYANGDGVKQDDKQALYWYQKAATGGSPEAQTALGLLYLQGKSVTLDKQQALSWFQKATAQNYANGQYNLALLYAKGEAVTQDDKQAAYWYQKAAEQNLPEAEDSLAIAYNTGTGLQKDDKKALELWGKAIKHHYAPAQYHLGIYYVKNKENLNKAGESLEEAALQKFTPQQQDLALFTTYSANIPPHPSLMDLVTIIYSYSCDKGDVASCANFARLHRPQGL